MVRAGRIGAPAFKRDVAGAAETPQRGPEVVKRAVPVAPEIGEDGEVVKRAVPLGPGKEREGKEGVKRAVADDSEGLRRPIEASASGLEGMSAMAFKRAAEEAFEEQEEENAARFRRWLGKKNENQDAGDRRRRNIGEERDVAEKRRTRNTHQKKRAFKDEGEKLREAGDPVGALASHELNGAPDARMKRALNGPPR